MEDILEIILMFVGFAVGALVLGLFGIETDVEWLDAEAVACIGIVAIFILGCLILFAAWLFKKFISVGDENDSDTPCSGENEEKSKNGSHIGGPKKINYKINKPTHMRVGGMETKMYRIGIDLGGTNIAAAVVGEDFKIVKKKSVPTGAERDTRYIMDDMAELCRNVCAEAGITLADVEAIGIASPGVANHTDGIVEYTNNLDFKRFPICRELSERLGIDNIHVENDANAAAWGEAIAGAAKGTKNSVMITLGTGVGGGVIIDGKVFSGFNYAGAELGHTVIEVGGRQCTCGRRGCWEAYSSATALINMTKEKLSECEKSGRETKMTDIVAEQGKVSGRTAFDGMRAGDAAAKEVIDMYIRYLSCGLINMINIFQPEVLSIGGGISGEGQPLVDMMMGTIKKEQYGSEFVENCKVRIAELGNDAGIIGAAFLGI